MGPTKRVATLNEKHTLRIYLTWGLFEIKGNTQYGLSGPEWLVRRVDRCVEMGERFLFYFIYTLYTTTYTNGKLNRHRHFHSRHATARLMSVVVVHASTTARHHLHLHSTQSSTCGQTKTHQQR